MVRRSAVQWTGDPTQRRFAFLLLNYRKIVKCMYVKMLYIFQKLPDKKFAKNYFLTALKLVYYFSYRYKNRRQAQYKCTLSTIYVTGYAGSRDYVGNL